MTFDVNDRECQDKVDLISSRMMIPRMITFMLTNVCSTKCCYCYADTDTKVNKLIPTERVVEIIQDAKRVGVYNIGLIGGEVFLHPNWDIILKAIVDNGFLLDTISTKIPITEKIISKLKDTNFQGGIQISLDTLFVEHAMKTLHVGKNYIKKMKAGIELLEKSSIKYNVETVLTKTTASIENINKLFEFFSKKKNVKHWEVRVAMFSNNKDEENFIGIKSDSNTLNELYKYIDENIIPKSSFPINTARQELENKYFSSDTGSSSFKGAKCSALNEHFFILPDGKVTICEQLYWNPIFIIGNMNYQGVMEVWNSDRVLQLLQLKQQDINDNSACKSCKLFDDCFKVSRNRCWSDIIKAYGYKNWDFPDPRCVHAPKMKFKISYK